jgi:hypothetical protein
VPRWFTRFGRHMIAMLCIAQCLMLSGQAAMAAVERIEDLFKVEHAPTALAGGVVLHDEASDCLWCDAFHANEIGKSGPQSHCHVGDGALTAWYGVSAQSLPHPDMTRHLSTWRLATPPDAPIARQDRPPKHISEA